MQITSFQFKDFFDKSRTAEEIGKYNKGIHFYETTDVDGYWIHFSESPDFQMRKIYLHNNGKIANYAKKNRPPSKFTKYLFTIKYT
jgi:hypothetical protein